MMTFTILDASNTARVTMVDPRPAKFYIQSVDTLNDPQAIEYAVFYFALRRMIPVSMVEVSTVFPAGKALFDDMKGQL